MPGHVYDSAFYDYISSGSRASANVIVPLVLSAAQVDSVLDVGAGNGSWLAAWLAAGIDDALAVDGDYVDTASLAIPSEKFRAADLSRSLDLGRRFGLVQSLEVAEHIAEGASDTFVDNLTRHGDIVMFSAAVPNQGGEFHVNEQPPEYWRAKFAARGYACFDWLRPRLAGRSDVKPWYRFNTLVYANAAGRERLSADVLASRIADDRAVPVCGDFAWNARRAAVSLIPQGGRHMIARAMAAFESRAAQARVTTRAS